MNWPPHSKKTFKRDWNDEECLRGEHDGDQGVEQEGIQQTICGIAARQICRVLHDHQDNEDIVDNGEWY